MAVVVSHSHSYHVTCWLPNIQNVYRVEQHIVQSTVSHLDWVRHFPSKLRQKQRMKNEKKTRKKKWKINFDFDAFSWHLWYGVSLYQLVRIMIFRLAHAKSSCSVSFQNFVSKTKSFSVRAIKLRRIYISICRIYFGQTKHSAKYRFDF